MNPAKKSLLIFRCVALLCLIVIMQPAAKSQSNKIYGELQLLNGTKNVSGYLFNTGNGITIFKNPGFSVSWDSISGKPLTFPPSPHTHYITEVLHLADSLSALRSLINTKISVELDPAWHADSANYYKKVAADARFYPLNANPANYISRKNLSAVTPIIYDSATGIFTFDTTFHHSVGYYDQRYINATIFTASKLISGGVITKLSDYTYNISASTYYINGTFYSSPSTNVTLSAPAELLDRIDVFVLTTSGAGIALGGTPSNNPVPATYNVSNQLPISFAYVKSATNVTPGGAVWGNITGTITDQEDLDSALATKFNIPDGDTTLYVRGDGSLASFPDISGGENFANTDLIFTADRTHDGNGKALTITNLNGGLTIQSSATASDGEIGIVDGFPYMYAQYDGLESRITTNYMQLADGSNTLAEITMTTTGAKNIGGISPVDSSSYDLGKPDTTWRRIYVDTVDASVYLNLPSGGGGADTLRFGIEDNTGAQDRSIDMGGYNFSQFNIGTGLWESGNNTTDFFGVYLAQDHAEIYGQKTLSNIISQVLSYGDSVYLYSVDGSDNSRFVVKPNDAYFQKYLGPSDILSTQRFASPAAGDYFIPLSINGILADSTGNITIADQEFTDNAAAITGGLTAGMFYRTGDVVKIVH